MGTYFFVVHELVRVRERMRVRELVRKCLLFSQPQFSEAQHWPPASSAKASFDDVEAKDGLANYSLSLSFNRPSKLGLFPLRLLLSLPLYSSEYIGLLTCRHSRLGRDEHHLSWPLSFSMHQNLTIFIGLEEIFLSRFNLNSVRLSMV